MSEAVIWHDLECGTYDVDLPLWRELAAAARGPVLDLGAGTGRVALDLGRRGHEVVALDVDADLLAALRVRAAGAPVETVVGDARDFDLSRHFALILVPMQTVQLLSKGGRAGLLLRARAHLASGGALALAIADALEGYDEEHSLPPVPDIRAIDGILYSSLPVLVVDEGSRVAIERRREIVQRDGSRSVSEDVVRLERLSPADLEREGEAAGFRILPRRIVPANSVFVGSTVVVLGA